MMTTTRRVVGIYYEARHMAHNWEEEAGRSSQTQDQLDLKFSGQPGLQSETLSQSKYRVPNLHHTVDRAVSTTYRLSLSRFQCT